jgi:hypothetical protein
MSVRREVITLHLGQHALGGQHPGYSEVSFRKAT